jgi:predicted Zn-dependent protease
MAAVQNSIEKVAMVQELAQFLGVNGSIAAVTGYTREFETEADRVGLDLMAQAGYDPRQALNLFEHLRQEIEIEGIKEPFFFGTHPSVQQRIENASLWLATEYSGKDAGLINSEIFRSRLEKLVLDNARLDLRIGRFYIAQSSVEKYLRRTKPISRDTWKNVSTPEKNHEKITAPFNLFGFDFRLRSFSQ